MAQKVLAFAHLNITEFWISIESKFMKSEALGSCHMNYVLTVISESLVSSEGQTKNGSCHTRRGLRGSL